MISRYVSCVLGLALTAVGSVSAQPLPQPTDQPRRHVYVPVDDLDAVIDRDRGGVMLSREEYEQLEQAARAAMPHPLRHPTAAVLSQADYAARRSGDQLLVTVTARVTSFTNGWARLTLPAGGAAVENALLNGEPAKLARDHRQPTALLLYVAAPGEHTLVLELSTPLVAVGGERAAALELHGAPVGVLTLDVPPGKHLNVNGAQPQRPAAIEESATYSFPVGGLKSLRLRITDRAATTTGDALTFAQSAVGVYVAPGEITWSAKTALQVYGRAIDTLVCTVPDSLELTGVESTGLESWELADAPDAPDRTQITLHYRQPWDAAREITFRGLVPNDAETAWTVPDLTIREVTSHVGRAVVQFPPGVRLQMVDAVGIRPVLAVNGMDPAAPSLEYEVWQENFRLAFLTAAKEREVHAAMTTLLDVNAAGLDLSVMLDARTLFAPLFDLQLHIPAEWTVRSATVAGAPVEWQVVPLEAGINQVQIPLNPPLAINESRSFTITAHRDPEGWPVEQTPIAFALPEVRLPQVGVIEALYGIAVDDDLDVRPLDVTGLDPARKDDSDLLNSKLAAFGRSIRLGYTYQDTVFRGQLDVSRRPSRVAASTVLFFRPDEQSLFGHLESQLDVTGGGIRELQASVSESAGTDLRFRLLQRVMIQDRNLPAFIPNARIVEQIPGEPAGGLRPWTLKFDRRLRGQFLLVVDVQTPLPAPAGDDAAQNDSPFILTIPGADRESGHIAIESNGEQLVQVTSADTAGAPLPTVDPVDFPPALYRPAERVVAGFRYAQPGWTMTVARTEFERQPVPTAVIHSAQLKSVISETGEMQNQADYSFTAIGVQSLRLQFSQNDDGAEPNLWAVLIDGKPVEIRSSDAAQLIALPPADSPQQVRSLRISYRTQTAPLDEASGRLHQTSPQLAAVSGAGEAQPLEILDQQWLVYHPRGTLLVDSEGRFHPSTDLDRGSFLGRIEQLLRAPGPQDLAFGAVAILAAIGVAWLLSLGYLQKQGVGVIVAVLIIGAVLVALMLPAVQQAREAAQRTMTHNELRQRGLAIDGDHESMSQDSAALPSADFKKDDLQHVPELPSGSKPDADADSLQELPLSNQAPQTAPSDSSRPEEETRHSGMRGEPAIAGGEQAGQAGGGFGGGGFPGQPDGARVPLGVPRSDRSQSESRGRFVNGNPPNAAPLAPFGVVEPTNPTDAPLLSTEEMDASDARVLIQQAPNFDTDGNGFINQPASESFDSAFGRIPAGRGALLSLTFDLQPPPDYIARDFIYRGDVTADGTADLNLVYASRRAGGVLTFTLAVAAVLLCWMIRGWSRADRLLLAAILLFVPVGLLTVAPTVWLPVLDGLFLGGLVGIALWGVRALFACCEDRCFQSPVASKTTTAATMAFIGTLLLSGAPATAQDSKEPVSAPAVVETVGDLPEQPPLEGTQQLPPGIIIPYDAGTDPLTSQRVFLSHEQFLDLFNRAHPDQRLPVTAPVDGLVSETLYAARLEGEGDAARIAVTARFVVHNLRTQQVTLQLPLKAVSLTAASLNGGPAAIKPEGNCLFVVLDNPGTQVLDVNFAVPARLAGPAGEFTLPLLPAPAGKLSFALPGGDDLIVSVAGNSTTYRIREQDGARYVETPVNQGGDVSLSWRPRTQRGDAGTVIHVSTTTALQIGDAGVTHGHALVYQVRQGSISELAFHAPLSLSLKRIAGPDVGGWELSDTGDARQFRVFLRRAVDDETSLILEFHQPLSVTDQPQSQAAPEITLADVTRETGVVGIYAPDHFVVRAEPTGASQINAAAFAAPLLGGLPADQPRLAFRYSSRPVALQLTVSRRQPETRATAEHGVRVELRKLHVASRFQYELAGAPRLALSFDLPAGFLPLDVQAQYLADWYVSGEADARLLTIELDQPRTGAIEIVLEGHVQRQPDEPTSVVDVPQPLSVNRLQSRLAIWLDASYTASLAALGHWKSIDPAGLSAEQRALHPDSPQFAFHSTTDTPQTVSLSLQRATPQLTADSITLAAVSETSVDYGMTLRWKVRQAAADTFVLTTPGWLKGRLEFNGTGIRNVDSADLDDGRTRWTIALVDPVQTEYLMTAVATLPPPASLRVELPDVLFERPGDGGTFSPLATQAQYAVLVNLSGWQMSPADAALVNSIGRDELPFELRDELLNQAMEIVLIKSGSAPAWQLERLAIVASADATVTAAEMNTVLDYDGSWRMRAVYTVRNRGRQFLALNLPEDSRVLSVFVRGVPSRTVLTTLDGADVHLVALPQTSIADLSFDVELVLAGRLPNPLPEGFNLVGREFELPAPTVVTREQAQAAARNDLGTPVIHTQWTVELPDGIDATIVDSAGRSNMTPEEAGWELALSRAEADVAELTKVLEDPFASATQKRQAASNLKGLGLALQRQQSSTSGSQPEVNLQAATDEYFRRNGELQQEVERNVRLYESANGILNGDGDQSSLFGDLSKDAGRDFIASNSAQILGDNRDFGIAAGSTPQSSESARFNFSLSEAKTEGQADDKAARKGGAAGRGKLREQLKEQSVEELEQLQRGTSPLSSHSVRNRADQNDTFWQTLDDGKLGLPNSASDRLQLVFPDSSGSMGRGDWSDQTLAGMTPALAFAAPASGEAAPHAAAPAWTTAGGLSLPMTIPRAEQSLRFDKVGGEPKLTLALRPRRALTLSLGTLWTVACLVGGLWLVRAATRNEGRNAWHAVPLALIAVGLLGFLLIPGGFRWFPFVLFTAGVLLWFIHRRRAATADDDE